MTSKLEKWFTDEKSKAFYYHVKKHCDSCGVNLQLRDVSYLRLSNNIKCSGYFDDINLDLVVAMNSPIALEIFVHEYAHLTQWQDNCLQWRGVEKSLFAVEDWLAGKRVMNISKHIDKVKLMELDNEKRAVKIINKFKLPIDVDMYVRRANSYVYFYNHMKKTRRWSTPQNSPYKNDRIVSAMPAKFLTRYTRNPKYVQKLFTEEGV